MQKAQSPQQCQGRAAASHSTPAPWSLGAQLDGSPGAVGSVQAAGAQAAPSRSTALSSHVSTDQVKTLLFLVG